MATEIENDAITGARYEDSLIGDECEIVEIRDEDESEREVPEVVLKYDGMEEGERPTVRLSVFRKSTGFELIELPEDYDE